MFMTLFAFALIAQDARLTFGETTRPRVVAFSPDGKMLASGGGDRAVTLWDAATGKELAKLEKHLGTVCGVTFTPDGKTLVAVSNRDVDPNDVQAALRAGRDIPFAAEVVAWDLAARHPRWRQQNEQGNGICLALSADGKLLATSWGLNGELVRLWDPLTEKVLHTFEGRNGGDTVRSLAFSPDGATLAAGAVAGVRLLDVSGLRQRSFLPIPLGDGTLTFGAGGKVLVVADRARLRLLDATTGRVLHEVTHARPWDLVAVPGRDTLVAAGWDNRVRFLDIRSGKELTSLEAHEETVWCIALSPDGRRMATVGGKRDASHWLTKVKVWDVPNPP